MNTSLIFFFAFFCHRRAILQNADLDWDSPLSNLLLNDFWGTPLSHAGSHKSYRPVCTLTFRLNRLLNIGGGGAPAASKEGSATSLDPTSFHLVNILLHALATYLFAALLTSLRANLGITRRYENMFMLFPNAPSR